MYTLEKNNTSPLCVLYTLMPHIIPLLTLMLVCTWYEGPSLGAMKLILKWFSSISQQYWIRMRDTKRTNVALHFDNVKESQINFSNNFFDGYVCDPFTNLF